MSENASIPAPSRSDRTNFDPLFDGFLITLSVVVVAINAVVIFLFFWREYLQTKTNSLLVSLAVSDLTVGLLGIPMNISCNATLQDSVCIASVILYRFVAVSTMYHILVITLERYIFVMYPMKYINIVTAPRLMKLIASVWLFSLFVSLIQLSWHDPEVFFNLTPTIHKFSLGYNIFGAIFCFFLPLVLMVISYTRMFMVIHRQIKEIRSQYHHCQGTTPHTPPVATEARALGIFATMLIIFTVCWSSWYIVAFYYFSGHKNLIPQPLANAFDFLRFSVAFVNPILYAFLKRDFARALRSLCKSDGVEPRDLMAGGRNRSITLNVSLSKVSEVYREQRN